MDLQEITESVRGLCWQLLLDRIERGEDIDSQELRELIESDPDLTESTRRVLVMLLDGDIRFKRGIKSGCHPLAKHKGANTTMARMLRDTLRELIDEFAHEIQDSKDRPRGSNGPRRAAKEQIARVWGVSRSFLEEFIRTPPNK
jgi:hypothetical protein